MTIKVSDKEKELYYNGSFAVYGCILYGKSIFYEVMR